MVSVLQSPPCCGEVPPGARELLVRPHSGEFSTSAGKSRGVSVPFPAAAQKLFRVPFCYQGRAVPAGSSEVDRGEVGHPDGRRRALAGPGSGSARLTLALVVGRHLVAAFILLPPSGAPGRDVAAVHAGEFQEASDTVTLRALAPYPSSGDCTRRVVEGDHCHNSRSGCGTARRGPSTRTEPVPLARGSRLGPPRGKSAPCPGTGPAVRGARRRAATSVPPSEAPLRKFF